MPPGLAIEVDDDFRTDTLRRLIYYQKLSRGTFVCTATALSGGTLF